MHCVNGNPSQPQKTQHVCARACARARAPPVRRQSAAGARISSRCRLSVEAAAGGHGAARTRSEPVQKSRRKRRMLNPDQNFTSAQFDWELGRNRT